VEGDSGTRLAKVTLRLTKAPASDVVVSYRTNDGSAFSTSDYTRKATAKNQPLKVTFKAGQMVKVIAISVNGDTSIEGDETFFLDASVVSGPAVTGDGHGVITIIDDEGVKPQRVLSIGDATVTEGDAGTTQVWLSVTLDRPASGPVIVKFATANGTAVAPGDYVAKKLTSLKFSTGQVAKTIAFTVATDTLHEGTESFTVVLSSPTGAVIGRGTGTVTIVDDD
jgi:chitinase